MPITLDGTSGVTFPSGAVGNSALTSGTAVASTGGTSIDFTGIPSWVKRITVMFNNVSTSGASYKLIQIGSGSVTTTGYIGGAAYVVNANTSGQSFTNGAAIITGAAGEAFSGNCVITLQNPATNTWTFSGTYGWTASVAGCLLSGASISLSGTLDRVRITTVNGTDTFDLGSINILYE